MRTCSHGHSQRRDIAQQASKNTRSSWVGVIVGGLMTLGAGAVICTAVSMRSGRQGSPQRW
jgi:hypothetical protein